MIELQRKYHFYAAHRNPDAGIKCGRIHGHTYHVVVTLHFYKLQSDGITILFDSVDKITEPIVKQFDHYFILWDKDPLFETLVKANEEFKCVTFKTSAENLANYFFDQISLQGIPIVKLELMETESSNIIITKK